MAAIDDLVSRVADEQLRQSLQAEIEKLKGQKTFGLVWEEHLKERAELWGVAVRSGMKVARKGETATYLVQEAAGEELLCTDDAGDQVRLAAADVVAVANFGEAVYPCLVPVKTLVNSREGEAGLWHILIEAENFHALQLLRYLYRHKVDAIYIDPPYNTGARDWKYNNDYVDAVDSFRHSKWLSMMKVRLEVARELLNPADSVLIVTIDEKEYAHLSCLLEEMFPDARVQMVSVAIHPSGVARSEFSRTDEYYFFVFIGTSCPKALPLGKEWQAAGTKRQADVRWESLLRSGNNGRRVDRPNLFYPVLFDTATHELKGFGEAIPLGIKGSDYKPPAGMTAVLPYSSDGSEACWRVSAERAAELKAMGAFDWGAWQGESTALKYLKPGELSKIESGEYVVTGHKANGAMIISAENYAPKWTAGTQWTVSTHNAGGAGGSVLLKHIFKEARFAFPKSVYAVRDALRFFVEGKPDALIVDFFAGSGTTAHAVNLLNAADGGHRRCVMVTNNEVSADEARTLAKRGIKRGDDEWEKLGIARYVTWPRTVCAITGRDVAGRPLSGSYAGEYPFATRSATGAGEASNAGGTSAGAGASGTGGNEGAGLATADTSAESAGARVAHSGEEGEDGAGEFELAAGSTKSKDKASAGLAMSRGFSANAAFFTLRFLDKEAVALGKQFRSLLPLLWLKAGPCGSCPVIADTEELLPWYVFAKSRFAVLLDEAQFGGFQAALAAEGEGCRMVYLVTDSGVGFKEMSAALAGRQCVQLYKDYLENFRINTMQ